MKQKQKKKGSEIKKKGAPRGYNKKSLLFQLLLDNRADISISSKLEKRGASKSLRRTTITTTTTTTTTTTITTTTITT